VGCCRERLLPSFDFLAPSSIANSLGNDHVGYDHVGYDPLLNVYIRVSLPSLSIHEGNV
jgi:hypothetical protein